MNAHSLSVTSTGGSSAAKFSTTNAGNMMPAVDIEKTGTAPALQVENIGGSETILD